MIPGVGDCSTLSTLPEDLMVCELCSYSWDLFLSHKYVELANNTERHSFMVKCDQCGDLYDVIPEERRPPARLTIEEARNLYPGAL
jgi:hypothetical protein